MWEVNPVAFSISEFDIRWYGILIAIGILLATYILYKRAENHKINPDKILDMVLWVIPIGVIGARLYYVVFNWAYYNGNIMKMLDIRSGGLAIHGGLIFGGLTLWILCRLNKYSVLNLLDLAVSPLALAQAIGRWGNFFNGEAHGGVTTLPWAITVNGESVHPTFLYESLWCLFLFVFLSMVDKNRLFNGQVFLLYGILYSLERFFVEYLRTDSLMLFGTLKQAMVLSGVVFVVFLVVYYYMRKEALNKGNIFKGKKSKYIDRF